MLTLEEKKTIYSIIKGQFPDSGVYRTSRISEWLMTNGYSLEKMGYNSFRDFAEDFPELFSFQNDYNDVFIVVGEWEEGTLPAKKPQFPPCRRLFRLTEHRA